MSTETKGKSRTEQKPANLRELTLKLEKLERDHNTILQEAGLSFEQVQNYIDNPDNFSQPIWQKIQNEKKQLSEKLDLALQSIRDPDKIKKTFDERGSVRPHWIFVR